jgi:outer membrane biosynthesis protein TonB
MGKGWTYSALLHMAVIAIGYYGLPHLRRMPLPETQPIMVDLVEVSDITNAPSPTPKPKEKPKEEPPPEPEQVVKASPVEKTPPPEPEPEAEPEPKPEPEPPLEAEPAPPVETKPVAPPRLAALKPLRKPKPPDAFASVLKTVADLKRKTPSSKKEEDEKTPKTLDEQVSKALASKKGFDSSQSVTISEIDLVRQQIARCWNLPAGAKDAENLVIEINLKMNPDGTVREARIRETGRLQTDSFFRAVAESALRAVLNPSCNPFKLPRDKYARWKTITLSFNPKEMFGI